MAGINMAMNVIDRLPTGFSGDKVSMVLMGASFLVASGAAGATIAYKGTKALSSDIDRLIDRLAGGNQVRSRDLSEPLRDTQKISPAHAQRQQPRSEPRLT